MAFENLKSTGIKYVLTKLKDYFLQIRDAVKTVNGEEMDENGNITITSVPYAQNLESESSQRNTGTFIQRTSGGSASIENGDAWLMKIMGNSVHEGFVAESITMTVTPAAREEGVEPITAEIDRDTFVAYVDQSGTTTLVYSTEWSANPELYGITVTGTPIAGDSIAVVYVKEVRGTITVAEPNTFVSTGWNLYDHTNGYAKVVKYEDAGYGISGSYSAIKYSDSPTGTQIDITVTDGNFNIPDDGYVIVTGGNSTDTAIYPVWSDWTEGYTGSFTAYNKSEIDLTVMFGEDKPFPYGLLKVGGTADELDLNLGQAISRIDRMDYSAENLATAKNSGRDFEYDEDYIYIVRATPVTTAVTISGSVTANDHGIEYFTGSEIPIYTEILYGNNLKNKLERDVVTKSTDIADNLTTNDATKVLSAKQGKALNDHIAIHDVSFSLESAFSSKLTVEQKICYTGNTYIVNIRLTVSASIPSGESFIGTASTSPKHGITGVIVLNSDTTIVGSFHLVENGKLYINLNNSLSSGKLNLTGVGITR